MQRVENAYRQSIWRLRKLFDSPSQTIAPVLWLSEKDITLPSTSFSCKLTTEEKEKLDYLSAEIRLFSCLTNRFPARVDDATWKTLLECENRKQRLDHLNFLASRDRLRSREKEKKAALRLERQLDRPDSSELDENRLFNWNFHRVVDEERRVSYCRVANAHRLSEEGPKLAIDCRFLSSMSPRGADLTALQLRYAASENRDKRNPWPLFFVNFDSSQERVKRLYDKHLSGASSSQTSTPIITAENYTCLAEKDKIVYLSPHADEVLQEVKDDEVYVIGGIVDRVPEKGIDKYASRVAAETDGIRCAKMPLEEYVKWKSGTKYLTLLAVMGILQEVQSTGDWSQAFKKYIPVRNVRPPEEKNQNIRSKHEMIRNFNREILAIVERKLGKQPF